MIDKERLRKLWHKLRPHLLECGHPICNLVDHRGKKHPNRNRAMLVSIMRNKLGIVFISNTPEN